MNLEPCSVRVTVDLLSVVAGGVDPSHEAAGARPVMGWDLVIFDGFPHYTEADVFQQGSVQRWDTVV